MYFKDIGGSCGEKDSFKTEQIPMGCRPMRLLFFVGQQAGTALFWLPLGEAVGKKIHSKPNKSLCAAAQSKSAFFIDKTFLRSYGKSIS